MSRRPVLQVADSNADLAHGEISPGCGDGSRNAKGNRGSVPFASGVTYTPAADVMRLGSGDFAGADGRCPAVGIPAPSAACSRGSGIKATLQHAAPTVLHLSCSQQTPVRHPCQARSRTRLWYRTTMAGRPAAAIALGLVLVCALLACAAGKSIHHVLNPFVRLLLNTNCWTDCLGCNLFSAEVAKP